MNDSVKVTAGLRYTTDKKTFDANTSASNLLTPGFGYTYGPTPRVEFKESTGRLNVDWRPNWSFTDKALVYASSSRGYRGGGFNPPNHVPQSKYGPEFINDYGRGLKSTLLDSRLQLNVALFYYDYRGYQFTQAAVYGTKTSKSTPTSLARRSKPCGNPRRECASTPTWGISRPRSSGAPTATPSISTT